MRRHQLREGLVQQLRSHGFEPFLDEDGGTIRLRNCPFHALACEEADLVCGMNLQLVEGMVGGIGESGLEAVLDARPDHCCVALRPRSRRRHADRRRAQEQSAEAMPGPEQASADPSSTAPGCQAASAGPQLVA